MELRDAHQALSMEDVYDLATRGRVADIDAALARFSTAVRLRDLRAIALRAARNALTGDMQGSTALLQRALAHSTDPERQYLIDMLVPNLYSIGAFDAAEEALSLRSTAAPELHGAFEANRAIFSARRGDDAESRAAAATALEEARQLDNSALKIRILHRLGLAAFHRNDFEQAQERAIETARAAEAIDAHRYASNAYSLLYVIAYECLGDPDLTRLYAERISLAAERAGDLSKQIFGLVNQLEVAMQAADYRRVGSIRARLLAFPHTEQYRERSSFVVAEALFNICAGRFAPARALLASALQSSERTFVERSLLDALIALVDVARGDREEAKRRAHRVIGRTAHHADPEPLHETNARRGARVIAAGACILAGESTRGRRALSRAFDPDQVFASIASGEAAESTAPPMMRGYAAAIAKVRSTAIRPAAAAGLTKAELEVLLALPDGGSLDQIARSAGKSRNTVAAHVKGIYRKLGVSSRTQALTKAREMHLLT